MAFELRPYQRAAVDAAIAHVKKSLAPCLLELATGCHGYDHPILMADGRIKPVQDIGVGDLVMGPDGNHRTVIKLHRGTDEMFRITPTKGEPFVVNGGHILSLYQTPRKSGVEPGYKEISVNEYIMQGGGFKHIHKLQRCGVDFCAIDSKLDPWVVGVFLGDGCITGNGSISICSPDHEIITGVERHLSLFGCGMTLLLDHRHAATCNVTNDYRLRSELFDLELLGTRSGTKFIPDSYKLSSRADRLGVIAGLLDTDGYLTHSGYDYVTKSERLADDVVFVCRSLGLAAYKSPCQKSCQNGFTGNYFRVSISGDCSIIPCRVERKRSASRNQIKRVDVTGFSVESVGRGCYYGFELDGDHLYLDGYFVRHHNSGKSLVVAELAAFMSKAAPGKKVLCVAPSRELVLQNAEKYRAYGYPASVYCASAGSKCLRHQVIFASPQTAIKQIEKIAHMGVSAIIIDEAHGITDTMRNLIEAVRNYELNGKRINEKVRIIGMTATPYRLGTGYIYAIDGTGETDRTNDEGCSRDPYYSRLVYRVQAGELVEAGFLSRAVVGESSDHYDTQNLKTDSFGRFSAASVAEVFDKSTKTEAITAKILAMSADRMGVIIFAATINHAEEIAGYLPPEQTCVITGKTPKKDRESLINRFKARQLKYLVNVAVLTTGFDAPHVDVVVVMRPTESAALFQQMIGRGLRLHPDKESALILDYAENIERHGLQTDLFTPQIRTMKEGGEGVEIELTCPVCGYHSIAKRRCEPEYDGLKHDEFGNFLIPGTEVAIDFDDDGLPCKWNGEVMTINVTDYGDKDDFGDGQNKILPMPAHYTRRCKNDRARIVDGMPQECDHRYTLKHCPECNTENDIAARQCVSCKTRLVDPNEKLTRVAGDSVSIAVGESVIVDCMGIKCKPHVGATGKHSLRVTYHTAAGHITAYHTQKQHWIFKMMCYSNGMEPETIDPDYSNCAGWAVPPKTVKIKKTEADGFSRLEIKEVHYR